MQLSSRVPDFQPIGDCLQGQAPVGRITLRVIRRLAVAPGRFESGPGADGGSWCGGVQPRTVVRPTVPWVSLRQVVGVAGDSCRAYNAPRYTPLGRGSGALRIRPRSGRWVVVWRRTTANGCTPYGAMGIAPAGGWRRWGLL
ncbi:hypothetical protein PCLA_10r0270 [Pseudomonas citronellolis]|nr:hypothetical protein PCLA_10r0270 [Pseudomonas citronellolis]